MALVIAGLGLNPSNRNAGFPNLARSTPAPPEVEQEVSETCRAELQAAGIHAFDMHFVEKGEVPSRFMGSRSGWQFHRRWYYWSAQGPGLPLEVADRLYEAFPKDLRVAGHCGCPSPREWYHGFAVGLYHIDSPEALKGLADALKQIYDDSGDYP